MSSTTIKNLDKIKMLEQMLEDLAGEEFVEYSEAGNAANPYVKRLATLVDLSEIDNLV